jgi:hypothetical protein
VGRGEASGAGGGGSPRTDRERFFRPEVVNRFTEGWSGTPGPRTLLAVRFGRACGVAKHVAIDAAKDVVTQSQRAPGGRVPVTTATRQRTDQRGILKADVVPPDVERFPADVAAEHLSSIASVPCTLNNSNRVSAVFCSDVPSLAAMLGV